MSPPGKNHERLIALVLVGVLAFNYPLLFLFGNGTLLFGIPVLYLYLFVAWAVFIVLGAILMEWGIAKEGEVKSRSRDTGS